MKLLVEYFWSPYKVIPILSHQFGHQKFSKPMVEKKQYLKNYHIRPFVYGVPKPDASNEKLLNYFSLTRICHFEDNIIMIQL